MRKEPARRVIPVITATIALFLLTAVAVSPVFDTRSLKPLAQELKPILKSDDEIVNYWNYYQDLPVYLERRVTLVDWRGELEFGMTIEDTSGWMISDAELWRRWDGQRRLFLGASSKSPKGITEAIGAKAS